MVNRRTRYTELVGFERPLPLEIAQADPDRRYPVPLYLADDPESPRVSRIALRVRAHGLVSADKLELWLNARSLGGETCYRERAETFFPYDQWLEIHLQAVRPVRGANMLELALTRRAAGLASAVEIEDVEVIISHGPYPSGL